MDKPETNETGIQREWEGKSMCVLWGIGMMEME